MHAQFIVQSVDLQVYKNVGNRNRYSHKNAHLHKNNCEKELNKSPNAAEVWSTWTQQIQQEIFGVLCTLMSYFPVAYNRATDLCIIL